MNKIDLEHRCAVITGGAQGIGFAIAERLLASGASLSLWDANEELLRSASHELSAKGEVQFCPVDVTDAEAVQRAADLTVECLGRVDNVVPSARITGPNATYRDHLVE